MDRYVRGYPLGAKTTAVPLYCNVSYYIAIASHHSLIVNCHIEIAAITIRLRAVTFRLQPSQLGCELPITIWLDDQASRIDVFASNDDT